MTTLAEVVERHRVVVCVGSGGVGKTTTAAALALHGAMRGRKSMVLTIDPARRLAQALGLGTLASHGERISEEVIAAAGLELRGSLSAGMLDQKSAWDDFIARHAPSEDLRDTILGNEFYQHLSRSFAGSTEYMAIEELYRIDESGRYDLVVLDTPPTGHALDFLEAPRRLEAFLNRGVVGMLVKPTVAAGWSAWKGASRTARFLLHRIEDATGLATLGQISDFFVAMEALFDGITERGRRVRELLAGEQTAFVLVAGPEEQVLGESEMLTSKMRDLDMPLKGVVMNRLHPMPGDGEAVVQRADLARLLEDRGVSGMPSEVFDWLWRTYDGACTIARGEGIRREEFELGLEESVARSAVAERREDVHDLGALAGIARELCGDA